MQDKILKRISRRYTLDKEYMQECAAFDDMVNMIYELPEGLRGMEEVVEFTDPGAHDAEKAACNIFDTYDPKWDILPRGPDDKDKAERMERWLEWQMDQANEHGDTEPFREMMVHALRYGRVCSQLDYLPYWLPDKKKRSPEQKAMMSGGPFCIVLHKPYNVHYEMGKYALRWVSTVARLPAAEVLDHWSGYKGKLIDRAISKIEALLDDDEEAEVVYVDYTDIDERYVCAWVGGSTADFEVPDKGDIIEIGDEENSLGFINWVISKGSSDPFLTTLHRGNLWKNTNDAESIKRTNAYRRAFFPLFIEEGHGEDVQVELSGVVPNIKVPTGKRLTQTNPPPLDPAFNELSAQDRSLMSTSTSIQTLQNITGASNVQYATINAMIQLSLVQLESYKRTAEKALKGLGRLCFLWVKKSGDNVVGYRKSTRKDGAVAGEQISISPKDFDDDSVFITATLLPNAPTDKMQLVNMAKMLKESGFPIPDEEHMERLGFGNPEALKDRWFVEQAEALAFTLWGEEQKAQLQMMIQQKQAQMQDEAQARMAQQNAPEGPPAIPGGEGFSPNQGGSAPAEAAPQMTQTAIQGTDVTGRGV